MSTIFGLINNLKTIKQNIYTSLVGKGVVVGENNKLEDVPAYIDGISAGASETWKFQSINNLFSDMVGNLQNKNIFTEIMTHVDVIAGLNNTFKCSNYVFSWLTTNMFQEILTKSNGICSDYLSAFANNGRYINGMFNINMSNTSSMESAFSNWRKSSEAESENNVVLDFGGTTNNMTNFYNAFSNSTTVSNLQIISEILNINMDKATYVPSMFGSCQKISRITFQGSFGGLSTTTSITLDISSCTSMTTTSMEEMFTSLSPNTNLKTRTIKIPTEIYSSLTPEQIAIATNKGYTVTA